MLLSRLMAVAAGLSALAPHALAEEGEGGGLPHVIDYYDIVARGLGLDAKWGVTFGAITMLIVITLIGLYYKGAVAKAGDDAVPDGRFSMRFVVEMILDMCAGVSKDNTHDQWKKYFPFLSTLFIFILACNLSGLIPGFSPPTESMDTNVAMGVLVFLLYNWAGLKEHGGGYIKHFLGPVAFIAPLFFCIELVSHCSRPLSLGLRLMGNIFGDHTLLGVFTKLTWVVIPALLMFFGLLVAVVQSFVFTLLSGIYISMAISHDH